MKKVILRLIVVAVLFIAVGAVILSLINIPGNSNKILTNYNNQATEVSNSVEDKLIVIKVTVDGSEAINSTKLDYNEFILAIENYKVNLLNTRALLEKLNRVNDFKWDEEIELNKYLKKFISSDNELNGKVDIITEYMNRESANVTVGNMCGDLTDINLKATNANLKLLQEKANKIFTSSKNVTPIETESDETPEVVEEA